MYMSKSEAKELGLTHKGSYFGIPVYVGEIEGEFCVEVKFSFLFPLMEMFHYIEAAIHDMRGTEHSFQFKVGEEL